MALGVLWYSIVSLSLPPPSVGALAPEGRVGASDEDMTPVLILLLTAVSFIDTMFKPCHHNRRSIHLK